MARTQASPALTAPHGRANGVRELPQLVPSHVCLQCDVCCRFPERSSFLRPFFTAEEIARAVAAGLNPRHFPDASGGQIELIPHPAGEGFICPAFDPATSQCLIYADRPFDCRLYPLTLMWDRHHEQVLLGWDTKCPFLRDSLPATIRAHAKELTAWLEDETHGERAWRYSGLIGPFQEEVVPLWSLPRATARLVKPWVSDGFRLLTMNERGRFEDAVRATPWIDSALPLAAFGFAYHACWLSLLPAWWKEEAGLLYLAAESPDGLFLAVPPLGTGDIRSGFDQAFALMRKHNGGSAATRIENVPGSLVTGCRAWGYRVTPKGSDYLYRTQDLVALAGDAYKSQRAACNRYEREHGAPLVAYLGSDREACAALFREWRAQKSGQDRDSFGAMLLADAESAHRRALDRPEDLGLEGAVVRLHEKPRAYTFGYWLNPSVFCVLFEVADRTIPGLAQYVFREFCRQAGVRGATLINTMDDSGLPTLARSKRAYHPHRELPNFIVTDVR
jgi:hypothetical protein